MAKLRQADVELGNGQTVKQACRVIEVSEQTYYRWRQKVGGMSPDLIKELEVLQKENQRLRKAGSLFIEPDHLGGYFYPGWEFFCSRNARGETPWNRRKLLEKLVRFTKPQFSPICETLRVVSSS